MYFIIGIDIDDEINELGMLEFIHNMVETLDKYFENVCELDVSDSFYLLHGIFSDPSLFLFFADNV